MFFSMFVQSVLENRTILDAVWPFSGYSPLTLDSIDQSSKSTVLELHVISENAVLAVLTNKFG